MIKSLQPPKPFAQAKQVLSYALPSYGSYKLKRSFACSSYACAFASKASLCLHLQSKCTQMQASAELVHLQSKCKQSWVLQKGQRAVFVYTSISVQSKKNTSNANFTSVICMASMRSIAKLCSASKDFLACKNNVRITQSSSLYTYKPFLFPFTSLSIKNFNAHNYSPKSCLVKASFQPSRVAWDLPELLDIQRDSFNNFVKNGIPDIFSQMAPITVERGNIKLQLLLNGKRFEFVAPDDSPRDCILKMKTYSCKIYVEAQILYTTLTGQPLSQTKSEWILVGHLPIMTKRGHFIINGSPRVIVHQVVRSPGIYFQQVLEKDENKRIRFYGDIIPRRGVWLRLQITKKGKIEGKLKKGKRVSADMLQKCFQLIERLQNQTDWWAQINSSSNFLNLTNLSSLQKQGFQVSIGGITNSLLKKKVDPLYSFTSFISENHKLENYKLENSFFGGSQISRLTSQSEQKALLYTYDKLYRPVEDKEREERSKKTRNRLFSNSALAEKHSLLEKSYKNLFSTFKDKSRYDLGNLGRTKINTKLGMCLSEKNLTARDLYAITDWLNRLTKGEKSVDDIDHFQNRRVRTSGELLHIQFENGIERLRKLAFNKLKELIHTKSNQRVVGHSNNGTVELMRVKKSDNKNKLLLKKVRDENKNIHNFRTINHIDKNSIHFARKVRSQKVGTSEFLNISVAHLWISRVELKELLSTKPLNGSLRELFGSNPLSQYMDQTNPLAEITHKRRMSSLGVGGVSRESAGMAIRGIHSTHYGRICPIETPEGKNAGLVNSLAFYAKTNSHGFVETPYYKVVKSQVQHELGWSYVTAKRESVSHFNIAPSDLQQSWNNVLTTQSVPVRVADNLLDVFKKVDSYNVDCMFISPVQMISVATSLIPFLEHNDANRALMGSNMQRQAVPLMIPERAIVGTGFETLVVAESGHLLQSECSGFVSYVSSNRIVVDVLSNGMNKNKQFEDLSEIDTYTGNILSLSIQNGFVQRNIKPALFDLKKNNRKRSGKKRYISSWMNWMQSPCLHTFHTCKVSLCNHRVHTKHKLAAPPVFTYPYSNLPFSLKTSYYVSRELKFTRLNDFHKKESSFSAENSNNSSFQHLWLQVNADKYTQKLKAQTHMLDNWDRSNQDTCLTQRALVKEFDWVQKGDILTDCSASDKGELAVGKNILVAYIPWEGYNFEDAIVISERLVKQDVYTSLHVERYDFHAQDVKEGSEWFTNDLPGIPRHKVAHLNKWGLPQIGSFVKEGDILVGKMRYSNKKPTTPYERLLCDILGENNFAARDSSLYVPKGVHARVIKHKIVTFSENASPNKRNVRTHLLSKCKHSEAKDTRMQAKRTFASMRSMLASSARIQSKWKVAQYAKHSMYLQGKYKQALIKSHAYKTDAFAKMSLSSKQTCIGYTDALLASTANLCLRFLHLQNQCKQSIAKLCYSSAYASICSANASAELLQTSTCDLFASGSQKNKDRSHIVKVPKVVHIFLGEKRAIQVGDKMSGRHGNKGVVAKILPRQDMPYLADGTPIDIILNPLGVPSRMNVGQVFEALLGLAGTYLGQHFKITAWDELYGVEASQGLVYLKLYSAKLQSGQNWLFQVDFPGKTRLIDGRSGECFDQWVTVGKAYMLKLIHMVNEKIHARATGPYALITQQPLRGRSQKGGQRLGEMEVWALEGWGAAYTLQELCTKKSDDIVGRKQVASTILPRPTGVLDMIQVLNKTQENRSILGQPEIFKVLICELQALCLDVGVYSLNTQSFQRSFLSKVE